jgi:hypothetical protein
MITCTLGALIAELRRSARAAEARLTAQSDPPVGRAEDACVAMIADELMLFNLSATRGVRLSELRLDIPVRIERSVWGRRAALRTGGRSRWSRRRERLLTILLDGEGLSHVTASLDGRQFREEQA